MPNDFDIWYAVTNHYMVEIFVKFEYKQVIVQMNAAVLKGSLVVT